MFRTFLAVCYAIVAAQAVVGQMATDFVDPQYFYNAAVLLTTSEPAAPGAASQGSGLLLADSKHLHLVTAKHVLLKDKNSATALPALSVDALWPQVIATCFEINSNGIARSTMLINLHAALTNDGIRHVANRDFIVIRLGTNSGIIANPPQIGLKHYPWVLKQGNAFPVRAMNVKHCVDLEQVIEGAEVFSVGFPLRLIESVGADARVEVDRPLLRKGIVAGKNIQSGRVVLDCPSYAGNSGGPVAQVVEEPGVLTLGAKRLVLIGIQTGFVPDVQMWRNEQLGIQNAQVQNSGYSLVEPIDAIVRTITNW